MGFLSLNQKNAEEDKMRLYKDIDKYESKYNDAKDMAEQNATMVNIGFWGAGILGAATVGLLIWDIAAGTDKNEETASIPVNFAVAGNGGFVTLSGDF